MVFDVSETASKGNVIRGCATGMKIQGGGSNGNTRFLQSINREGSIDAPAPLSMQMIFAMYLNYQSPVMAGCIFI